MSYYVNTTGKMHLIKGKNSKNTMEEIIDELNNIFNENSRFEENNLEINKEDFGLENKSLLTINFEIEANYGFYSNLSEALDDFSKKENNSKFNDVKVLFIYDEVGEDYEIFKNCFCELSFENNKIKISKERKLKFSELLNLLPTSEKNTLVHEKLNELNDLGFEKEDIIFLAELLKKK